MKKKVVIIGFAFLIILLTILSFTNIFSKFTGNIVGKAADSQISQGTTAASASESTTTYIYAGTLMASKTSNSYATTYYLQDHLGSNIEVLENTTINQKSQFYVFGESNTTSKDNKYLYTGKELDYESGLYYYGARYYDPEIGRFIQADALTGRISDPMSLNRYVYTRNNPLAYIDPSGNEVVLLGTNESNAQTINELTIVSGLKEGDITIKEKVIGGHNLPVLVLNVNSENYQGNAPRVFEALEKLINSNEKYGFEKNEKYNGGDIYYVLDPKGSESKSEMGLIFEYNNIQNMMPYGKYYDNIDLDTGDMLIEAIFYLLKNEKQNSEFTIIGKGELGQQKNEELERQKIEKMKFNEALLKANNEYRYNKGSEERVYVSIDMFKLNYLRQNSGKITVH
jgi:RHS repeat-associated protein